MKSHLPARFQHAFSLLMQGAQYANALQRDVWDLAVELHEFSRIGFTANDLRYLLQLRYVDHAIERTTLGDERRRFQASANLQFTKRSCFVLTHRGRLAVSAPPEIAAATSRGFVASSLADTLSQCGSHAPQWDADRHMLFLGAQIVKRFKWHAPNQISVLSAFQEEGWPVRIDDPLKPSPEVHAKRRLSDTIKCLNRNQLLNLIRFRSDGRGQGVTWEAAMRADERSGRD